MNRPLGLLAGAIALALGSGCGTVKTISLPPENSVSIYFQEMLRPAVVLGTEAGVYWIQEKKWPASIDDLATLPEIDPSWKNALATLSQVTFVQRSDGSLTITGKTPTPQSLGRVALPAQKPVEFTIHVRMRPAPGTTAGWEPQIETDIAGKKGEDPG